MLCQLCPRNCKVNTLLNKGYCGKFGKDVKIAKVMRHMWEEPIISGKKGSGAIFFSHCSLKCCFCQNYCISHLGSGKSFTDSELANIFKLLEDSNVENINLVTPTHYTNNIINALNFYKPSLPIVWNTSGYEKASTIDKLKDYVDIFLFDFKYFSSELSLKYSKAEDYFKRCISALKKAREIIPEDIVVNGIMKKGIIIRHLVLPNCYLDSLKIFENIKKEIGTNVYISVMSQFTPFYKAKDMPELNKKLKPLEYKKVVAGIKSLGFNKGFIQDFSSASCDYTPNFDLDKFYELN